MRRKLRVIEKEKKNPIYLTEDLKCFYGLKLQYKRRHLGTEPRLSNGIKL